MLYLTLFPSRKGRLQPVQMTVVQRTGNKKVTLVDNLDLYGISAVQLAHTVQRLAASSTTGMLICESVLHGTRALYVCGGGREYMSCKF